jgi:hypothetical protein
MDFDYKKYSLENLENWMHDAMSAGEATPQEIYDVIRGVVEENYYTYKHQTSQAYELLALLNGNGQSYEDVMREKEYYEPSMPPWGHSDLEYMIHKDSFLTKDRNSNFPNENTICDRDDPSPECKGAWNDFWDQVDNEVREDIQENGYEWTPLPEKDKVVKWQLPVEIDDVTEEYFVSFPDDLLEAANLKEGDTVEWFENNGDGSYTLRKV